MATPLNPGEANRAVLLFITDIEIKFQRMMVRPPEIKFDGKGESLRAFVQRIREHAALGGMAGLYMVPDAITGNRRNLLENYGIIPIQDVRVYVQALYNARGRDAQDDQMLFLYLASSLTEVFERDIKGKSDEYTIRVPIGEYMSGLLFLKIILSRSQVATRATVSNLRKQVGNLPNRMTELHGNVVAFNDYVRGLINDFAAFGASCDEMIDNVMWAYGRVDDEQFHQLANNMNWEFQKAPTTPLDVFMTQAENEYNIRVQMGEWKSPSPKDLEITALKATIAKGTPSPKAASAATGSSEKTPKKSFAERIAAERISHPWKWIAPNAGASWSKTESGIKVNWCSKHEKWVTTHTDAECKGAKAPSSSYKKTPAKGVAYAGLEVEEDEEEIVEGESPGKKPKVEVKVDNALTAFVMRAGSLY